MSAPPYMRFYWGDYHHGTRRLRTAAQHGAYLLLIGELWDAGGKLDADEQNLASLALCTPDEWAQMRDLILPFFHIARGKLTHKRVSAELEQYASTVEKRKLAGKRGGLSSDGKDKGISQANAKQMPSKSTHNQNQNQNQNQIEEEDDDSACAPDWNLRLEEAKAVGADGIDLTSPSLHSYRDLRALCEPAKGEACSWDDVIEAVRVRAHKAAQQGPKLRSWTWITDQALSFRDRRLAGLRDVSAVATGPPPSGFMAQLEADRAEARRRVLNG